jgi:hypothetical protein
MAAHVPEPQKRERGSSPWEGELLRPLTRCQVEDRLQELGELYEWTSGGGAVARDLFLRRLAAAVRRPGFSLVVAGNTDLTGVAYGFPVRDDLHRWDGYGVCLPTSLLRLAATDRLFVIPEIVVPPQVRNHYQNRDWNLARRLQKRLLADHGASLGVTLVFRGDTAMLEALCSWGWRYVPGAGPTAHPPVPRRALVLRP